MKTTAEKIAVALGNDGQVWETPRGTSLEDLCDQARGRIEYWDGWGTDTCRWTFPDGSALTVAGAGWDIGYPECYCWQGIGHDESCKSQIS